MLSNFKYIKDSIIFKLLKIVFAVYFVFTFTLTCVHLYANYNNSVSRLQNELASYARSFRPTLFKSMHFNDNETIKLTVDSLMLNPDVVGVEFYKDSKVWRKGIIKDEDNKNVFMGTGKITKKDLIYLHSKLISFPTDLSYIDNNGEKQIIGKAILYSSYRIIFDEIKFDFTIILANALLKTIVLWNLFIWSAATFLSKPLGKLASKLEEFELGDNQKIDVIPQESGARNELHYLQGSFNTMIDNLNNEIQKREVFQKALKRSEQYLQNLFNAMPSILISIDKYGYIRSWNVAATEFFSKKEIEVLNQSLTTIVPEFADQSFFIDLVKNKKKIQKIDKISFNINNQEKILCFDIFPADDLGEIIVLKIDDITDKSNFETMIIQTEKMSSLGTLVAGIAHEINNPLSTVIQGIQNINRRLDLNFEKNKTVANELNLDLSKVHDYIKQRQIDSFLLGAQNAGQRAADIVKSVLNFSRKSDSKKIDYNISTLIAETIDILKTDYSIKKSSLANKVIYKKSKADEIYIYCVKSEIQQVILNIIKNSVEELLSLDLENPEITISCQTTEKYIEIYIDDNGKGVSEKHKSKIFEPFYTTKAPGKGTGLGLYISYNIIVERHLGSLTVDSNPKSGARFIIRLPISKTNTD